MMPPKRGFAVELGKGVSPLCMLLARTNISCQACLAMQQRLEQEARIKPKTLKCFAGLCETAVPVRVGENIVAWLETGHILIDHPTKSKFNSLAKTLLRWGTHVDLKQVEEAVFQHASDCSFPIRSGCAAPPNLRWTSRANRTTNRFAEQRK